MTPQLFLDNDGVLADLDSHYEKLFGVRPNQDTYEPPDLWDNIRKHGSFYRDLPLMSDAMELWYGVKQFHPNPIILTGIPYSIPNVKQQKQEWVWEHFGCDTKVICCRSVDKCKYGKPGDILVDDRKKYMDHWIKMGGIFVRHASAHWSLIALGGLYGTAQAGTK